MLAITCDAVQVKNRGNNLRQLPEAATSISSHYTPIYSLIKGMPVRLFDIPAVQSTF